MQTGQGFLHIRRRIPWYRTTSIYLTKTHRTDSTNLFLPPNERPIHAAQPLFFIVLRYHSPPLRTSHRAPSSALAARVELISIKTTRGSLATRKMSGSGFTKVFNSARTSCRGSIDVNSYRSIKPVESSLIGQTDRQLRGFVYLLVEKEEEEEEEDAPEPIVQRARPDNKNITTRDGMLAT